jgi:ferritin-like metal-binding protein YciE
VKLFSCDAAGPPAAPALAVAQTGARHSLQINSEAVRWTADRAVRNLRFAPAFRLQEPTGRTIGLRLSWEISMATMPDGTLKTIFVTGLRNAHAMESQAQALLQRQIERLDSFPDLKARMQTHLEETRTQQGRLDRILAQLGESSSTLKDAAMSLMGDMAAMAHMPAQDEVLKNSFASFAFENYETAAYKSLIAVAERIGAADAVGPLKQSCQEEEAMAQFLSSNLDAVTKRYIDMTTAAA